MPVDLGIETENLKDCKNNCGEMTFFDFCGLICAREFKARDQFTLGAAIEAAGQEGACYP